MENYEFLLLTSFLHADSSVNTLNLNELCDKVTDWDWIVKKSSETGLGGLMYRNLINTDFFVKNHLISKQFKAQYDLNKVWGLKIKFTFNEINENLSKNDISFAPLKGIYFILEVYKDPGLRFTSDIDLLFKRSDSERYTKALGVSAINFQPGSFFTRYFFKQTSVKKLNDVQINGINIDVHEQLFSPYSGFQFEVDDYWNSATLADGKKCMYHFSVEHYIVYLAAHLFRHLYKNLKNGEGFRFIWFKDIDELIRKSESEIDWDKVYNYSVLYRCEEIVYAVLKATENGFKSNYLAAYCKITDPVVTAEFEALYKSVYSAFYYLITGEEVYLAHIDAILKYSYVAKNTKLSLLILRVSRLFPSRLYLKYQYPAVPGTIIWLMYPFWLLRKIKSVLFR